MTSVRRKDLTEILLFNYNSNAVHKVLFLTFNLLTTTIVAPPSIASKWQMGYNSVFKGLKMCRDLHPPHLF
jgi:hypothetical protein